MRGINNNTRSIRLAIALATGTAVAAVGMSAAPAMAQKKAKETKQAFSKEFAAAAAPLQTQMELARAAKAKGDAGKAEFDAAVAAAAPLLPAAEAAIMNGDDRIVAGQFAINLGGYLNDNAMRMRGVRNVLDSGKLEAAKVPEFQFYLGNFAYTAKDYATARTALQQAIAGGFVKDDAVELMVESYARAGAPGEGLAELRKVINARRAANQPVPDAWLSRAVRVAYGAKLAPETVEWATMQVELNPSNFNWLGTTQLIRQHANLGSQETLDLFRLMARSGALQNEAQYVRNEYKEYIEAADSRRLPGEVARVIEQGVASGALNPSDAWIAEQRGIATGRIAADKASLAAQARDARAASGGTGALSTADAYLNYGDAALAEELYTLAIQKGGIDADRAWTRLGIAQYDLGKIDAAKASFAKVTGGRTPVARLWLIFLNQKSAAAV